MLGGQVTDTATLFEAPGESTVSLTFTLYGPGDLTCTGPPVFTNTQPVAGSGDYTSDPLTPVAAGTYRWVVSSNPEGLNRPVATRCDDPRQAVVVASGPVTPKLVTFSSSSVPPGGVVRDIAVLSEARPPMVGSRYTCSFTAPFTGPAGTLQVTRISVTVLDNEGTSVTANTDPSQGTIVLTAAAPPSTTSPTTTSPTTTSPTTTSPTSTPPPTTPPTSAPALVGSPAVSLASLSAARAGPTRTHAPPPSGIAFTGSGLRFAALTAVALVLLGSALVACVRTRRSRT